jgi:hypothetical protein
MGTTTKRDVLRPIMMFTGALSLAAVAIYVLRLLDEASLVQNVADTGSFCRRLAESAEATCADVAAQSPRDQWDRAYLCEKNSPGHVRVTSFGRDGKPHGKGANSDVICERDGDTFCACDLATE